ncbi:MAG: hypothetical protein ING59_16745 [Burkholderiales bacterium]|nr:hypothetical protein [Burkholderiales bacterium]
MQRTTHHIAPAPLLRVGLAIDAAGSGAVGLAHVAVTGALAQLMAVPTALILGSGLFMLTYAATLVVLARSTTLPRGLVRFIVVGNSAYVAGCLLLALLVPNLNVYSVAHLVLQALAVTGLVVLQARGLAQSRPADSTRMRLA